MPNAAQPTSRAMVSEELTMTIDHEGTHSSRGLALLNVVPQSMAIGIIYRSGLKLMLGAILAFTATGGMAEAPKHGGVLTYMIPADHAEPPGNRACALPLSQALGRLFATSIAAPH